MSTLTVMPAGGGPIRYQLPLSGVFTTPSTSYSKNRIEDAVREFARRAVAQATLEEIEPGQWFAHVNGLQGAWGEGDTPSDSLKDLEDTLVGWVELKLRRGVGLPFLYKAVVNVSSE